MLRLARAPRRWHVLRLFRYRLIPHDLAKLLETSLRRLLRIERLPQYTESLSAIKSKQLLDGYATVQRRRLRLAVNIVGNPMLIFTASSSIC